MKECGNCKFFKRPCGHLFKVDLKLMERLHGINYEEFEACEDFEEE